MKDYDSMVKTRNRNRVGGYGYNTEVVQIVGRSPIVIQQHGRLRVAWLVCADDAGRTGNGETTASSKPQ